MSWINLLYETYNNLEQADEDQRRGLLPPAHSTQKAHIEITIDAEGNFHDAAFVADKIGKETNLSETLIPVTESSSSRSNGSSPHPLADKLKYLASDYEAYTGEKNEKFYTDYLEQLKKWKDSEYSTPKVEAIYKYVSETPIIKQLAEHHIFSLDENGRLTDKWEHAEGIKLSVGKQAEAFIRFRVLDGSTTPNTWQDRLLQKNYTAYYISSLENQGLCYAMGKVTGISDNHPSKIRNSGDKAKLISSNDTSGFTYRGRFKEGSDAVQISYEVSQKFHNALKFLIKKQGQTIGEKVFLLWGTKNETVPKLNEDSFDFFDDDEEDMSEYGETLSDSAERFNKALSGYRSQIDHDTSYAIIGLDAATVGRLSVIYYREYHGEEANDLLDRIENWHKTAAWLHRYKFREKKMIPFYGAPSPYDIALCAFGTEQNGFIKGKDKAIAQVTERLLPCISDGAKIPRDIVTALVRKCYSPEKYSKNNWLKVLSITCAMYKKYLYDYESEVMEMSTNSSKSLSFNCGRLLAAADALESYAQKGKGAEHTTSAMRYFNSFSHNPCRTWTTIMKHLAPYIASLGPKANYLQKLMAEISAEIDAEEFEEARNLDGKMALGFYTQQKEIMDRNIAVHKAKEEEEK